MGFMKKLNDKEPYQAMAGRNGCMVAPLAYLITGFLALPPMACLVLSVVMRESLARNGDSILLGMFVLTPMVIVVLGLAYVGGERAKAQRGPETQNATHNYLVSGAGQQSEQPQAPPDVKVEKPGPKALPLGQVPWVTTNNQIGTITKAKSVS